MKCFQILNEKILVINDQKTYEDTLAHYAADGGSLDALTVYTEDKEEVSISLPAKIIYDDTQKVCVVNDVWYAYPNNQLETKISEINTLLAGKAAREYVPPTLEELRTQALNYQYQKYDEQKHAIVWLKDGSGYGFDCGESDQNNWQVALTLMENDKTYYRVYTDKNDTKQKAFLEVKRAQMLEAGNLVKAQQYAAYSAYEVVRAAIARCTTAEQLKPYLPTKSV